MIYISPSIYFNNRESGGEEQAREILGKRRSASATANSPLSDGRVVAVREEGHCWRKLVYIKISMTLSCHGLEIRNWPNKMWPSVT